MSAPAAQRGASRQASHTGNPRGECLQACHAGCSRGASRQACHAGPSWSKPLGLPCRRSRRQSDTIPTCTGVSTPSSPQHCPLHLKPPPQRGASRQACHAGGHAGRATQSRAVRESQRHPARMTARFTSSLSLLPICVSSVVCFSPCSPCPPWFVFLRVLRVLCGLPSPCPPPPCPPHPQSQPSPNLFPIPFQPVARSFFPLLLL